MTYYPYYSLGSSQGGSELARTGCFTGDYTEGGSPIFNNVSFEFVNIKSPEELYGENLEGKNKKIYELEVSLERLKDEIQKNAEDCTANLNKFIETKRPVCKGRDYFDIAIDFWNPLGDPRYDAYKKCLDQRGEIGNYLSKGSVAFEKMADSKRQFYAKYAELMTYAPSADAWRKLCAAKESADSRFEELQQKKIELLQNAYEKHQLEMKAQAEADEEAAWFGNMVTSIFEEFKEILLLFVQAIVDLIKLLVVVFKEALKGLSAFSKLLVKYPYALYAVGGIAAIGIVGFVFRPYFSIASTAIDTIAGD